jgi:hypothetical protein
MAGVTEEAGKATNSFINALGGQPVLLVQSLIIAGVVFILYAQGSKSFVEREQLLKSIFDSQQSVREILSKCIVPGNQRGGLLLPPEIKLPLPPLQRPAATDDPPKPPSQDPT